jgi:hypothetical protein
MDRISPKADCQYYNWKKNLTVVAQAGRGAIKTLSFGNDRRTPESPSQELRAVAAGGLCRRFVDLQRALDVQLELWGAQN